MDSSLVPECPEEWATPVAVVYELLKKALAFGRVVDANERWGRELAPVKTRKRRAASG